MTSMRCLYCAGPMLLVRDDAIFCTQKCGVYFRRKAKNLPESMARSRNFVRYNAKKVPFHVSGRAASSTNPETWASFAEAQISSVGVGIGYMLGGGVGCIDLDHCISDGVVADWAREILDANPGTFTEVSMSGDGIHIFGMLPEGMGSNTRRDGRNVEIYSRARYIALTGVRFENAPSRLRALVLP